MLDHPPIMSDQDGRRLEAQMTVGLAYFPKAGASQNVVNLTDQVIEFSETELK